SVDLSPRALPGSEVTQLPGVGQLAVPEQVRDLLEAAVGGQVLHGVAAVRQRVRRGDHVGDAGGVDDDSGQAAPDVACGCRGHGITSPGTVKSTRSASNAA